MTDKDQAFLKRLRTTFQVEANEHIVAISAGLVELEETDSDRRRTELIEGIFRETHSMKGAARSVNLPLIESLCESIESVFAAVKRREMSADPSLLNRLHRAMNLLGALVAGAHTQSPLPEKAQARELIGALKDVLANRPRAQPEIQEAGITASDPDGASPSGPVISSMASESVRVSKTRIEALLLQVEAFLSVKQILAHQTAALRDIGSALKAERSPLSHAFSAIEKTAAQDRRTIDAMVDSLMDNIKAISMLPFSSLLDIVPKLVRDLCHDRGKMAVFTAKGGNIEIDRRILDEMREPLIHLIRNCVDHGIEPPAERIARNKPESGRISIEVGQLEGNSVQLIVSDDGGGINAHSVTEAALKVGILSRQEATEMNENSLRQLIFRSGVSTSPMLTDISGRGLGLAIVRERVEKLGGAIHCDVSSAGGTVLRIRLPLTLSALRCVLVRVDTHRFLIPTTGLESTVRVRRTEVKTVENRETISINDGIVPLVRLGEVLELPPKAKAATSGFVTAAVLGADGQRIAFAVDEIIGELEVLIKGLGSQLVRVRNVAAATVLGTGEVVAILSVADLMKSAVRVSSPPRTAYTVEAPEDKSAILVVEDSITSRTLLKNILQISGYDVQTAVDGADGLAALRSGDFDLVVSDVDMPRMNGFELTARIRADKRLSALPVVLVTALESREDRERGMDAGANAYIVKSSFDRGNLLEAVRRLVG